MRKQLIPDGWALVFDLDGVIVDSTRIHTEAWREYLLHLGKDCEDIERRMHGRRNDEIVADFIGSDLGEQEIYAHGAAKEALYREMMRSQLEERLVPGAAAFIRRGCGGLLGLGSNAEPANIDFVIDGVGLRGCFRVIIDGHQVKRPKPDPEVYLRVAEGLGVAPQNCVVFEDSPAGTAAARAAGARVVGVRTADAELGAVSLSIRNFLDPALEPWLDTLQRNS